MPPISERDKRTLRWGGIGLGCYLIFFFAAQGIGKLEKTRREYELLRLEAITLKNQFMPYEARILRLEKLRQTFKMEVSKLKRETLAADTSAAIQAAAMSGGIMIGPLRESPGRTAGKEIASMQLEAFGQPQAVLTFLHKLETLGFPVILESLQLGQDATKPGMVKINLTIQVLDFEQWKNDEEGRRV